MNLNIHLATKWSFKFFFIFLFFFQNGNAQTSPIDISDFPFDKNNIIFPFDLITNKCKSSSYNPEELDEQYSRPKFLNIDNQEDIMVHYEDSFSPKSNPSCFIINRKWTVIKKSIGSKNKQWSHNQKIKVIDFSAPKFITNSSNSKLTFYSDNNHEGYVDLVAYADDCSPKLNYQFEIDLFNDNNIDVKKESNNASGVYPIGIHKITFNAMDECGNHESQTFLFEIKYQKTTAQITN